MPSPIQPGATISGFRVGRLIGSGSCGAVYEATQVSLERPAALRLLDAADLEGFADEGRFLDQQRAAAAFHHPGVVPVYEAGAWDGGRFVATRFVRGQTLERVLGAGRLSRGELIAVIDQVESTVTAVHGVGLVHGRISARNVIIEEDGRVLLTDLGLGAERSADDDRAAIAGLRERAELAPRARPDSAGRRRYAFPALAVLSALAVGTGLLVGSGSAGEDPDTQPPPAVAEGAEPLGSELAAGSLSSIGCARQPGLNTPACTLAQVSLGGRSARVRAGGVIRRWAVRDATGALALQVIGFSGDRMFLRSFSRVESVHDRAPHAFDTEIEVERGDLIGVTLTPGASIGLRPGGDGSTAMRVSGTAPYAPAEVRTTRVAGEMQLRVDVEEGARARLEQLNGKEAQRAPAGAALAMQVIEAPRGDAYRTELTRVGDALMIDTYGDGGRISRATVGDARTDGRLLAFEQCGFPHGFCLRWLNDGDSEPVVHGYAVTADGSLRLIG